MDNLGIKVVSVENLKEIQKNLKKTGLEIKNFNDEISEFDWEQEECVVGMNALIDDSATLKN